MKLSIVATLYKSSAYIVEFLERSSQAARALTEDYEIILVNDGSPDDSLAVALAQHKQNTHIKIIDLSRNFGHHKAIMTGLSYANGELIFLIDSDLEESPEWLGNFHQQMQSEGCDVVYGVQEKRKGNHFEQWAGSLFYRTFNFLSYIEISPNLVTARLMSRRYVDALLLHQERELFLGGLLAITGYEQRPYLVQKLSRGSSTYSLRHKTAMFIDGITSFSHAPLVGIFYIGVFISLIAGCATLYLIWGWLVHSHVMAGWTSVMVSIWLIGGLITSFIGVIGIYLSKIFLETKQRPYTIVRQVYDARD